MKEKRIIVVDDQIEIADIMTMALKAAGYQQIETYYDSGQALEAAKKWRPDLILSDVMMPNQSGPDIVDILDEDKATKGIPVIYATAADPKTRAELEARYAGRAYTGFLSKPFDDINDISKAVDNMFQYLILDG